MASVKFHRRTSKLKEASLYVIFTVDRSRRFEITLDEKVEIKHWNKKDQCVKGTHPRHLEINLYLQQQKTKLLNLWSENRNVDFSIFKSIATGQQSQKKTLFLAYTEFLQQVGKEKDSKTLTKYTTLEKHWREFDRKYSFDFPTVDDKFCDLFKDHLYDIVNPNYTGHRLVYNGVDEVYDIVKGDIGEPIGLFDDVVHKYVSMVQTFLKWAEKRGHPVNPAYKTWKVIRRRYPPITLTLAEVEKLENFDFNKETVKPFCERNCNLERIINAVDVGRDYLVLECRIGQRISDIRRFNLKDYSDLKWTFTPKKGSRLSSKRVTVHFKGYCFPALRILEKYNYRMPDLAEQKINDNIKTACKIAGINTYTETFRWQRNKKIRISGPKYEFLSNHTGRRSFVTIGLQYLPPKFVKDLAGIDSWATLKHYEGQSEDHNIDEALNKIPTTIMRKAN